MRRIFVGGLRSTDLIQKLRESMPGIEIFDASQPKYSMSGKATRAEWEQELRRAFDEAEGYVFELSDATESRVYLLCALCLATRKPLFVLFDGIGSNLFTQLIADGLRHHSQLSFTNAGALMYALAQHYHAGH